MADNRPAARVLRKAETVRERASKSTGPKPKRRVLQKTANRASRSLRVLSPIGKPFRTKPVRSVFHVIGLILWPRFLRNAWNELRMVVWPDRKETAKLTAAVFVFAIIFGILIAITDYGLDKLFRKVILK